MCYTCWEQHGSPGRGYLHSESILAVRDIAILYEKNSAGSYMHIVTDDWNLEDHNVEFCLNAATADEHDLGEAALCRSIATRFLKMTETERAATLALAEGFL